MFLSGNLGADWQVGAQSGFDLLIGKLVLRAVLAGVELLEGFITNWCSERFWGWTC